MLYWLNWSKLFKMTAFTPQYSTLNSVKFKQIQFKLTRFISGQINMECYCVYFCISTRKILLKYFYLYHLYYFSILLKRMVELHPHGITPIFLKCIKSFFLQFFLLYLIYSFGGYNRNKTRPWQPQIQFNKSGCNPVWVQYKVNQK